MKDHTKEWNEASSRDELRMMRDPNQKERDARRKKEYEDAVRAKRIEKMRTDPKFAEEWYKRHPEERPQE